MAATLDIATLRTLGPADLAAHFRTAIDQGSSCESISQHLLQAVKADSLSPFAFKLWISACPYPSAIVTGLAQTHSHWIRRSALKHFRRWFCGERCAKVWHELGGTRGVVQLMAQWGVDDVKAFCGLVRRCSGKRKGREERQNFVTRLVRVLLSDFFLESAVKNPDRRPFLKVYAEMVYACTPEFVDEWRSRDDLPTVRFKRAVVAQPLVYRQRCLRDVAAGETDIKKYKPLFEDALPDSKQENSRITSAMAFQLEVLCLMLQQEHYELTADGPKSLMKLLLKRAARRHVPLDFAMQVLKLLHTCMSRELSKGKPVHLDYAKIENDFFRLWQKRLSGAHGLLQDLFGLTTVQQKLTPRNISRDYIYRVPKGKRYAFMEWLFAHSQPKSIHLNSPDDLKATSLKNAWQPSLFEDGLPRKHAQKLLDNLQQARPDGSFLSGHAFGGPTELGLLLLRLPLYDDLAEVTFCAKQEMQKYMEKAQTSREAEGRAENAKFAIALASKSRSLDVFQEALIWARRFNRDPSTLIELYSYDVFNSRDAVKLLSGIPEEWETDASADGIAQAVKKGDETMLLLLDTAIICQREPSFQSYHWTAVKNLWSQTTLARLEQANELQSRLQLSDEAVSECLWESTLITLLKAEALGLDEDNQALKFNNIGGPLLNGGRPLQVRDPPAASLRFIDELAKRRDELWQHYRPTVHPAVAALEGPWPRGLPTHALQFMFDIKPPPPKGSLSYLEQRIRQVVFADAEETLKAAPEGDEVQDAIGFFVEDYKAALTAYVKWRGEIDNNKLEEAWKHATGPLSQTRMSALESKLFWKSVFESAHVPPGPDLAGLPTRPDPSLPLPDDPTKLREWNPDDDIPRVHTKKKDLSPTRLDCFIDFHIKSASKDITDPFPCAPHPTIPALPLPRFWDLEERHGKHIPPAASEAFIAAALLYIEGDANSASSILPTPFPSADSPRFPALFLDQAFLDRKDETAVDIGEAIWRLLSHVPPTLLKQLVEGLMERFVLVPKQSARLRHWTFETLQLLARSDRPGLALEYITQVLVGLPEESSWHRILLNAGILKRLPAEEARALLDGLKEAVIERLGAWVAKQEEEKERGERGGEVEDEDEVAVDEWDKMEVDDDWRQALKGKPVKITTVKMLAQMLNGASFVAEDFSVSVLVGLFERSKHLDVRVAVVDSLCGMLSTTRDEKLQDTIIDALETHALPLATDVSERFPMTEDRWHEAEEKCEPPTPYVSPQFPLAHPPICQSLEAACNNLSVQAPPRVQTAMLQHIYLPLITRSTATAERWTRIFLRKHDSLDLHPALPSVPFHPSLLKNFITKLPRHVPAGLFEQFSAHALSTLDPPPALQFLYNRLRRGYNPRYDSDEEKKIFFHLYERGDYVSLFQDCPLPSALPGDSDPARRLLSHKQLREHELRVMEVLMRGYEQKPSEWELWVNGFWPPLGVAAYEQKQRRWWRYCRPILQTALARIEALRGAERPKVLPDVWKIKCWLLPYPNIVAAAKKDGGEGDAERTSAFADAIVRLLAELASSGRPYHRQLAVLEEAAKKGTKALWPRMMLRIGALSEQTDVAKRQALDFEALLRIEFAEALLGSCRLGDIRKQDEKEGELVWYASKKLVSRWEACEEEGVRDLGWKWRRAFEREEKEPDEDEGFGLFD